VTHAEHLAIIAFIEHAVGGDQPPMDVEADAIIRALFVRNPDAAYRMTVLAMSRSEPPPAEAQAEPPRPKGWLSGLFEKREPAMARREPVIS
jgi:hypothetical protein